MKVRCDRAELGEALGALLGIVPTTQPTKPILANFFLAAEGEQLVVEANDLAIGARMAFEHVEVIETGEVTIPAARLASLFREIPDREIVIDGLEGGCGARLNAEGFDLKVLGGDPSEFPRVPEISDDDGIEIERDVFLESLRRVAIGASHDPARYQLTGVYFEVEGDRLFLTATDGKRLASDQVRIVGDAGVEARAIVPNRAVDTIMKVLAQGGSSFRLAFGDAEVHVGFGAGRISAKTIQGAYPDYRWVMSQEAVVKVSARRGDLLSAVRAASLMTDKETNTVAFHFEGDECRLKTQSSDIGESTIRVPVTMQGEGTVDIRFNPNYFLDAIRCLPEDEIRMEFGAPGKPGTLRGRQHYRHLIMPLVSGAGPQA